jgi:hypothetical protein
MSFRKEKKFRLSPSDLISIKSILLKEGMSALHSPRYVNSCYFDTADLAMFQESEEGVLPRKKVRVRWYDNDNKFTKEIKISSIEGRYKISKKIEEFFSVDKIKATNLHDQSYGKLQSTIIISYQREYYSFKGLRITFDTNITYQNLRKISPQIIRDDECVMEIKVPIGLHDDHIEGLIHHSTSRFSKYSRGLLQSNDSTY